MAEKIGIFFDTETTGIPNWKEPSEHPDQPHIVQLAAELVDLDTQEVLDSMDVIVKPDGWIISEEMTAIHGITNEHALEVGIPEELALDMLLAMRQKAVSDGVPIKQVCQQFGTRKKTVLSYVELTSAMQAHEISITDGHNNIALARIVVAGGGLTAAALAAMRRFKSFFQTLELPCWQLTNGVETVSLHKLKHQQRKNKNALAS